MATIVLPPQDCLSSPHNRQNSYLSRSEIGIKCFQAVMVTSPASQDCARLSHSGGSPPGDGLLPIPPLIHGQASVLSKRSPPSKVPTTLPRMFQESSPPRMKPKLPRSASAILPTPLVGSPPLAEGLLKGRLPFKVVQGNGPGNNNDHVQGNASKKLSNQRHGVRKKIAITSSHTSDSKADGNFEKLKSPSKLPQDGVVSRGQTNVRIRRSLEKSNSGKGVREKAEMKTDFPVVTILQRPKTQEAAVELFEKFFQNDTHQDLREANAGMEAMPENSEKFCVMREESESENQLAFEELSESESSSSEMDSCKTVSTLSLKSLTEVKKDVKAIALADDITSPLEIRERLDRDRLHGSIPPVLEVGCEELAPWERWAGPSYINSPPPSALPLPRFSKKHLKAVTFDNARTEQLGDVTPDQLSTPPPSISPLYISLARQRHLNINSDAVATATKDLKRILNLDLCRM